MDLGNLNLFIKMIDEEYKLTEEEREILLNRMLADDKEFEKVWTIFKEKTRKYKGGVDPFRALLTELIT